MFRRVRQAKLAQAAAALIGTTVLAQALVLATTPLLSRLYRPEDFGLMALLMAIGSSVLTVSSARYELAIVLPKSARAARQVWLLAQGLNGLMALLLGLVVYFASGHLAKRLHEPLLASSLWILPVFVLAAGAFRANNYQALREHRYGLAGMAKVVQSAAAVGCQLLLGLFIPSGLALMLGQTAGQAAGAARLSWAQCSNESAHKAHGAVFRWRRLKAVARRYRRFPLLDVPAALVDTLSTQLPNLLLIGLFGPLVAGWYVLAERIVMLPVALLGQATGQTLLGFSRDAIAGNTLYQMALRTVKILSLLAIAPVVILIGWSEPIFSWVFGAEWQQAGHYAAWLILGAAVQFVYAPVSLLLLATEGQILNLMIHVSLLALKAWALLWAYYFHQALWAIQAYALVGAGGYIVATGLVLWHVRRFGHLSTANRG